MRFSCDECGRSYVASDEVAGRAFRMRCKQCGSEVVVRPAGAAPSPSPAAQLADSSPAGRIHREGNAEGSRRPAFDPFEGDEIAAGDLAVPDESLEILDQRPSPPRPLPRRDPPAPAVKGQPFAPQPAAPTGASAPRAPAQPSVRSRRMLPAEDEAMLGPPGAEDRRTIPRWAVLLAVAALAAAGAVLLR